MKKYIGIFALLLPVLCMGQATRFKAPYQLDGDAVLPSHTLTPGDTDPRLTKTVLCSKKFRTAAYRHVTEKEKTETCKEYGNKSCTGYEDDHLISIELGGSNSSKNRWAQPPDAPGVIGWKTKDVVEDRAHRAVCSGQITLLEAQKQIAINWYAFGLKYGWIKRRYGVKAELPPPSRWLGKEKK